MKVAALLPMKGQSESAGKNMRMFNGSLCAVMLEKLTTMRHSERAGEYGLEVRLGRL